MATQNERITAVESHDWPEWARVRKADGSLVSVARQDLMTLEAVHCMRCRATASDALDMALPCASAFEPRGTTPPVFS